MVINIAEGSDWLSNKLPNYSHLVIVYHCQRLARLRTVGLGQLPHYLFGTASIPILTLCHLGMIAWSGWLVAEAKMGRNIDCLEMHRGKSRPSWSPCSIIIGWAFLSPAPFWSAGTDLGGYDDEARSPIPSTSQKWRMSSRIGQRLKRYKLLRELIGQSSREPIHTKVPSTVGVACWQRPS